jgi:hypothetical protein
MLLLWNAYWVPPLLDYRPFEEPVMDEEEEELLMLCRAIDWT